MLCSANAVVIWNGEKLISSQLRSISTSAIKWLSRPVKTRRKSLVSGQELDDANRRWLEPIERIDKPGTGHYCGSLRQCWLFDRRTGVRGDDCSASGVTECRRSGAPHRFRTTKRTCCAPIVTRSRGQEECRSERGGDRAYPGCGAEVHHARFRSTSFE